jgi:hypothetical protein
MAYLWHYMARKPNDVDTVQITISTTPPVSAYLKKLVSSGLYGKNPADAAERLVTSGIERLITRGVLKRRLG